MFERHLMSVLSLLVIAMSVMACGDATARTSHGKKAAPCPLIWKMQCVIPVPIKGGVRIEDTYEGVFGRPRPAYERVSP